jgi:phage terminase small subunit
MARKNGELTPKQERFVSEYLVDLNALQAAIRAGYSAKSAEVDGPRLLRNARVAAAVEAGKKKNATATGLRRKRILREVEILAHSRIDDYVIDAAGNVTVKEGKPDDLMGAISSIKRKEWSDGEGGHTVEVELRFWNKIEPLKLAGRYKSIQGFSERVDATAPASKSDDVRVYTGLPKDDGVTAGTA